MASALESSPSQLCPVLAPVKMLILKGLPAACSASAFLAISAGVHLGAPAGVNPLRPMVCPFWTRAAASAAVILLKSIDVFCLMFCAQRYNFFLDFPTFLRYFLLTSPEDLLEDGVAKKEFLIIFSKIISM